ncbi:MAG: hypothetical protein ACOCVF_03440 [bacterium]
MMIVYKCEINNISGEIKSHTLEIGTACFNEKSVHELLYETSSFLSKEQCNAINKLSHMKIGAQINNDGIVKKFL